MKIKLGNSTKYGYNSMYVFIITYRIIIDIMYVKHINRLFAYTGFNFRFNLFYLLLSWMLLFLCFPTIRRCTIKGNFSDVIVLFLVYLSYIPFTTMVAYYDFTPMFIVANCVYWAMLFLAKRVLPKTTGYYQLKTDKNEYILMLIEAVFALTIVYISWRYTGFRFTISLSDVYTYRAEARLASMPTVLNYIFSSSKAIMPVLLVDSLNKRRYLNSVFILIIQILSFSVNGSKTVLFSTILAVIFYFIYNQKYIRRIPHLLAGLSFVSFLETSFIGTFFILNYFIRRVLFLPNMLSALYFEFFSQNQPDYYRQSFLRLFGFKSPYTNINHVIGAVYFNKAEMSANNGLFSDAITNLGIAGVVFMPIILVLILKILDKCAYGVDKKLYITTSIIFAYIFISSFLPTVLLTHGLLILGIVLLLIPRASIQTKEIE